jgi:hypothetical protein
MGVETFWESGEASAFGKFGFATELAIYKSLNRDFLQKPNSGSSTNELLRLITLLVGAVIGTREAHASIYSFLVRSIILLGVLFFTQPQCS